MIPVSPSQSATACKKVAPIIRWDDNDLLKNWYLLSLYWYNIALQHIYLSINCHLKTTKMLIYLIWWVLSVKGKSRSDQGWAAAVQLKDSFSEWRLKQDGCKYLVGLCFFFLPFQTGRNIASHLRWWYWLTVLRQRSSLSWSPANSAEGKEEEGIFYH